MKKKKKENPTPNTTNLSKSIFQGVPSLKTLITPPGFDRSNPDYLIVASRLNGSFYVRSFVMTGYPSRASVGWLDDIINYEGDIDTAIYLNPADERSALDELTNTITKLEAQLDAELERGYTRNVTRLREQIASLYSQRANLEQHNENLFHVAIFSNLYASTKEELDKETARLVTRLGGRHIIFNPLMFQQDDAYKSALPFGKNYLPELFRNFGSGAATACFPFYSPEISHRNGIFIGINLATRPATPIFIDFFDRNILPNGNMAVIGQSGSGKTFFLDLIMMRSALRGVRTVVLDPEGDHTKIADYFGGAVVTLSPDTDTHINPFDLEEEEHRNGTKSVNIKGKIADLLNFVGVLAGGLTPSQLSITAMLLQELYKERGFTKDPESLYKAPYFVEETGEFIQGEKKEMPTLSDLRDKMLAYAEKNNSHEIRSLAESLVIFCRGNVYDLFDYPTSPGLVNMKDAPIICFNFSNLEENILRPIGMYVALTWAWEKFVKKNPAIKKCILVDEAWMFLNRNMSGVEYTAKFVNTCARRVRKRNCVFHVASQNFMEFTNNEDGRAVLSNAMVHVLLSQSSNDIDAVQSIFGLSQGERDYVLKCRRGEGLIKIANQISTNFYARAFPAEKQLIELNAVQKD